MIKLWYFYSGDDMKNGYTLIEVLAVIAVLGFILIIAVINIDDYLYDKTSNLFVSNARNILREIEYENLEHTSFDTVSLSSLNISGLDGDNIDLSNSYVSMVDDEFHITLVGKNDFDGLYLCNFSYNDKDNSVSKSPCS